MNLTHKPNGQGKTREFLCPPLWKIDSICLGFYFHSFRPIFLANLIYIFHNLRHLLHYIVLWIIFCGYFRRLVVFFYLCYRNINVNGAFPEALPQNAPPYLSQNSIGVTRAKSSNNTKRPSDSSVHRELQSHINLFLHSSKLYCRATLKGRL